MIVAMIKSVATFGIVLLPDLEQYLLCNGSGEVPLLAVFGIPLLTASVLRMIASLYCPCILGCWHLERYLRQCDSIFDCPCGCICALIVKL